MISNDEDNFDDAKLDDAKLDDIPKFDDAKFLAMISTDSGDFDDAKFDDVELENSIEEGTAAEVVDEIVDGVTDGNDVDEDDIQLGMCDTCINRDALLLAKSFSMLE